MTETPIETARRVWPGEWTEHASGTRVSSLALPTVRAKAFRFRVVVGWHHPRWTVTCDLPFGSCTIAQGNEVGDDLEAVLTEARDMVQGAVADVACAVGLEVIKRRYTPGKG
jgi:hypothetical protein